MLLLKAFSGNVHMLSFIKKNVRLLRLGVTTSSLRTEQLMSDAGMIENVLCEVCELPQPVEQNQFRVCRGHDEEQYSWCGATAAVHCGNSVIKAVAKFTVPHIIS